MQQFSEEFLSKWEHIINETEITDVPLECIKKVTLKFHNGKRKTINIQLLKRQGLVMEDIETLLNRTLIEQGESIRDLDWLIDVKAVAELIQPETDRILKGIK